MIDITSIVQTVSIFVLVFSILFLLKQGYGIFKAIRSNGEDPYIQGKYTALETGLALAYIITYTLS